MVEKKEEKTKHIVAVLVRKLFLDRVTVTTGSSGFVEVEVNGIQVPKR